MLETKPSHIVFFDGVCGLCNRFVDFIIRKDKKDIFRFCPLQGDAALKYLTREKIKAFDSIQYYDNDKIYEKSTAALQILIKLGGFYKLLGYISYIFPRFFRDWIYDIVANNRYKWFGKHETCRMPTPEERSRFLD